ncbi:Vacuolar protein sorting-associated protein 17 [Serendipita sp. 397]|nr:Vacuolar protein sorting-associated protein 17 [Serendipita sp. 397]
MSFLDANDPLSPFHNPHDQDSTPEPAPSWPTVPHSPTNPHPTLVKSTPSQPPPLHPSSSLDGNGPSTGPWGREPQVYGQPEQGLISPRETTASNGTNFEKPEPYLRVKITALDRNRRDILIRFDAQTNLSNFTGTTYRNVSRSYAEFQRFYEQIVYSNPQTIIPALPLAQTSAPSDDEDDRLVKVMLQRWFSRVCDDPILLTDEEVRSFVESDFGYQPTPRQRRKPASGFGLLSRRPPDEDEQLAQARFELTRLETQYIEVAKAVDKLSQSRKAMSFAHADMGNKLVDISASEIHPPLASATRKMGRSWHTLADIDAAQEISDRVVIGDSLGYQGLNARSAKETLLQRSLVLEEYQEAVKNTIAKRRNIERLKASSNIRPERVDDALEELEEANKVEQHIHHRVEGISQNLHRALHRHSRQAHDDLTAALIEHARMNLLYEKQMLRELESIQPDIRAAADPAPPPTILPAIAAIPPVSALDRSATMPVSAGGGGVQRPIITSGPAVGAGGTPITPGFPRTNQFSSPAPGSPAMTPGFPRTSQFVNSPIASQGQTPATPSFPKTNQFVGVVSSPLGPGSSTPGVLTPASTGGYSSFPRTNQFISSHGPPSPVVSPGFFQVNGGVDERQQVVNEGAGTLTPGYSNSRGGSPSPISTSSAARSPLGQSQAQLQYQQPALPSQIQQQQSQMHQQLQQQQRQQQQQQNVDPLGGGSLFITSQPTPSAPMLRPQQPSMAASIAGLPSRTNTLSQGGGGGDPLMGGMSQSMFVTPTTPNSASTPYGYAGGVETDPLGGTIKGPLSPGTLGRGTPTRSRLDAREAASKLANFL